MRRDNREKSNKGFTLVELIVVLVILAVLAAILTPALLGYIDQARSKMYFANAKTCFDAAQAMFSRQYGLNGEIKPGEALMPGTNRVSTSQGNEDRDIVGSEFSKELLRLAGLPEEVLSRARTIVNSLNENDIAAVSDRISFREQVEEKLKSLEGVTISENEAEIIASLKDLDVTKITPLEAMNILFEFHNKVNE